jgi:hypothetical protein
MQSPLPDFLPVPPVPPPALRGRRIYVEFRLDEQGRFGPSDLRVSGLAPADSAYTVQVHDHYRDARFRPAVFEGCAVPYPRWLPLQLRL